MSDNKHEHTDLKTALFGAMEELSFQIVHLAVCEESALNFAKLTRSTINHQGYGYFSIEDLIDRVTQLAYDLEANDPKRKRNL